LAIGLAAAPASASVVDFNFSTEGCFVATGSCTPSSLTSKDNPNLNFTGASFSGSTSTSINLTDLGVFTLAHGNGNYTGHFDLALTFALPTNVSPNPGIFTSSFLGSVISAHGGSGSVFLDFDNTPQVFNFDGGSFTLKVNDLTVPFGVNTDLTGLLTVTSTIAPAVPETSTWAMMLLGFAGIGFMAFRRKAKLIAV